MFAFGGIIPPAPCSPYAKFEGINNFALPSKFNKLIPSIKPGINCKFPKITGYGHRYSTKRAHLLPKPVSILPGTG